MRTVKGTSGHSRDRASKQIRRNATIPLLGGRNIEKSIKPSLTKQKEKTENISNNRRAPPENPFPGVGRSGGPSGITRIKLDGFGSKKKSREKGKENNLRGRTLTLAEPWQGRLWTWMDCLRERENMRRPPSSEKRKRKDAYQAHYHYSTFLS